MKRSTLNNRIQKLEKEFEEYGYSLCESVQDKLNFKQNFTGLLDTTRVFFFEKKNLLVLVDRPNGYKKAFKNPSAGLKEIKSWFDSIVDQDSVDDFEREQAEREHNAWVEEVKQSESDYIKSLQKGA